MTTELDINLLRRTLGAGASADDFEMFVQQCRRTGLDPFARQICMVLRRNKSASGDWQVKSTIMITIDGARLMAARTGLYNGSDNDWCGEDGVWHDVWLKNTPPAAARTCVYRGNAKFTGIALWREYGANSNGPLWKSMGAHLLAKCSEMLALRKGFPAELAGLYSADEMAQADTGWTEGAPVSAATASATTETPAQAEKPAEAAPPQQLPASGVSASAPPAAVAARRDKVTPPRQPFIGPYNIINGDGTEEAVLDIDGLCRWGIVTFPSAFTEAEDVKAALRGKGIKAWKSDTDALALQRMLAHVVLTRST